MDTQKDQFQMIDSAVLVRLVNLADLHKDDVVLEIGGGAGALTRYLLKIAKTVYVVEKDEAYASIVKEEFSGYAHVTFLFANALALDFPPFTKCVSNLPYTVAESLLWKLLRYQFECCVLVVPRRFVERLTGVRKSRLSLLVEAFYALELFDVLPPSVFSPQPKVFSQIIRLRKKEEGNLFLRELLSQYDKKVANALREILRRSGVSKREASLQVESVLPFAIAQKKVAALSLEELQTVVERFCRYG